MKARLGGADFETLLYRVDPIFTIVARSISNNRDVDDLVQIARLAVWKSLDKVKLGKPETIAGYIKKVGINAIKDSVRCNKRHNSKSVDDVDKIILSVKDEDNEMFTGLLKQYVNYIMCFGKFEGSHQYLAIFYRVSVHTQRRRFHIAVAQYLKELEE